MIDHLTVEKIIETAQIVDVIQEFVNLKRKGANYMGLCPFHNEKTPSFTVSPSKGIYKCFGCGKGGTAVHFIMEHEHLSYPEALKFLAKKYGIHVEEKELTEEERYLSTEKESLAIVNSFAAKYFQNNLTNNEEGVLIGLNYFKERGFNEYIIKEFQLGYSLEQRDAFTKEALKNGYKLDFLEKTGLSIAYDNSHFDRFAARVMFPIFGISGQVLGFGGRTLKSDKKIAKYLNSPESIIYNKSKILYGLFQAKTEIIKNDKCYLVEGYTDVLSLYMSGIKNVVASSGTSLTQEQVRLIHRFTENVTILYDGDNAGIKASLRGIDIFLEEGLNVRIVLFPDNEDPDSFSRKNGSTKTIEFLNNNEQDFIRFKAQLLNEDSKNDPIKRAALITDIVKSISVIDNNIKQSVYIQECSKIMQIDETVLYSEIAKIRRKKSEDAQKQNYHSLSNTNPKTTPPIPSYIDNIYFEPQENELIRLLIIYGNTEISYNDESKDKLISTKVASYIIDQLRNDELEMKNILNKKIFDLAEKMLNDDIEIKTDFFTKNSDPEISMLSANLCVLKQQISKVWEKRGAPVLPEEKRLDEILEDTIIKYKLKILKEAKKQLNEQLKIAKTNTDQILIEELIKKINATNSIIKEISKIQGIVTL